MKSLDIVVLGLSLSSSWGNGHATTYRALLRGLRLRGHRVLFLERDMPWYASHRDLPNPDFCELAFYDGVDALRTVHRARLSQADAVIVGSYVPDGGTVLSEVLELATGLVGFYDIDTPVTLAAIARRDCSYLQAAQIPLLDLYLSFTGGPILDTLRRDYGARQPHAFYCAVDETLYGPTSTPTRWDLGYLGTYGADRQQTLQRLLVEPARRLPDQRFVVAGPQYPDDLVWPDNVERIEHLSPADHAAFYGAQRYTLNITRADMVATGWSPSVRLFEAAACGTPIISDRWPGLTDLLPEGEAVLIADTPAHVIDILHGRDEARREALALEARRIVLTRHTGQERAAKLSALIQDVVHGKPAPDAPHCTKC